MSNKSIKKVLAVALLSAMGLVACNDKIQAKPTNYNEPIITFTEEGDEVYNNLVSIIDDAYRDGTLASAVLDKILYVYANSVFGAYNRAVTPAPAEDDVTLEEAAADVEAHSADLANATVAKKFLEKHKAYWTLDDEGERKADDAEFRRITAKWQTIEDRISRSLYSEIKGGSFNNDFGYFSEVKYLKDLRGNLYKVADAYDAAFTGATTEDDEVVITPDVDEENVWVEDGGYLHREFFQDKEKGYTYIEDEIVPATYRTLLVEQYLVEESYNNLGRSSARKINVLAISDNSNSDTAANYLMKYFVREKISKGEQITLEDFKQVSNAMKGIFDAKSVSTLEDNDVNTMLEDINTNYPQYAGAFEYKTFTGYDGKTYNYYNGTDYGDMMKNFEKIKKDINLTDSAVESDFTNSYTWDASKGLEKKKNEIKTKDYTVDGWYSESNGLGDLPDTIKSRLFNIGVANVLDSDYADRWDASKPAGQQYDASVDTSKLVAKINGK